MDLGLRGKKALITGGSHGIGLATAKALIAEGCELEAPGRNVIAAVCDVHASDSIEKFCDAVIAAWDGVDILINNVGGGGRWGKADVTATDEKVWHEVYEKNATAAIRFTMRFLPYMKQQKWGRVIAVTSRLGREGGGRPWFNMAKAAQTSMMKTLAMDHELAGLGITFNSVAPGSIMIPGTGWDDDMKCDPEGFKNFVAQECPIGRPGTPEEVANVIAFLSSPLASLVNGAAVAVDGGESRAF